MKLWLLDMITVLTPLLAEGSAQDENGGGWLLFAGPAAGVAVYIALFRYYRNTDKSHAFERETLISSQPITGSDAKIDEVRGTKRRMIDGHNARDHRVRVNRVQ